MDSRSDAKEALPLLTESLPSLFDKNASFPEKLMLLLSYTEKENDRLGKTGEDACIGWLPDGKAFVIRNPTELVNEILPLLDFNKVKFSSFTRKLYRWGFRQLTAAASANQLQDGGSGGLDGARGAGGNHSKVFWHPHFRRDDISRMKLMQSVTATSSVTRRAIADLTDRQDEAAKRLAHIVPWHDRDRDVPPSILSLSMPLNCLTERDTNPFLEMLRQQVSSGSLQQQQQRMTRYCPPDETSIRLAYPPIGEGLGTLLRVAMLSMLGTTNATRPFDDYAKPFQQQQQQGRGTGR